MTDITIPLDTSAPKGPSRLSSNGKVRLTVKKQHKTADTITALRTDNAALREGLAFYADKANYARFYNPDGFGLSGREPVLADFGKNARALLETNRAVK